MFLLWLRTTHVSYTQSWSVNILCISGSRAGQRQPGLYCLTQCVIYTSAFYSLADKRQLCTCMHFCWKYTLVVFFPIFAFSSGEIEWTAQCTLVRVNRGWGASQHFIKCCIFHSNTRKKIAGPTQRVWYIHLATDERTSTALTMCIVQVWG